MEIKVDNAVIMAAGLASRFAPLSYEIPKGLLTVRGEVLIERQIRQLHEAGITDVTVVVGHLKEKFLYLREKLAVDIVVNEDYARYNNTSTLMCILPRLKNTYVCSSDNYFMENVFAPYERHSYYSAVYFPGIANEWGIESDQSGRITGICHAPRDMWCMMGHVFFSRSFSASFCGILGKEYENETTRRELWESVYERHIGQLEMFVRKYKNGIIREFDSPSDVVEFDPNFARRYGLSPHKDAKDGCM